MKQIKKIKKELKKLKLKCCNMKYKLKNEYQKKDRTRCL